MHKGIYFRAYHPEQAEGKFKTCTTETEEATLLF